MPRYHVIMSDANTGEISGYINRTEDQSAAICNHPWIAYVYNNKWVASHIYDVDHEVTIANLLEQIGWLCLCVNLDEEIMKDLNAGDSNSSSTQLIV